MGTNHIKIFTGTEIIVKGLKNQLEDAKIPFIVKNNVESARLAGFGTPINSVSIYIEERDIELVTPIVNQYKESIG